MVKFINLNSVFSLQMTSGCYPIFGFTWFSFDLSGEHLNTLAFIQKLAAVEYPQSLSTSSQCEKLPSSNKTN